jgi:thioredoxin-dependent peroxiredoxin
MGIPFPQFFESAADLIYIVSSGRFTAFPPVLPIRSERSIRKRVSSVNGSAAPQNIDRDLGFFYIIEVQYKEMIMLKTGDTAPDFELESGKDGKIKLSSFKGRKVVLYFYPKDDTPGCTVEACAFRDAYDDILAKGAVVVGVSPDGAASHDAFRKKFSLPFYLLADPERKALSAYGAWGTKTVFGKTGEGVIRSTFVIGGDGKIVKAFPDVKPEGHAAEILEVL